MDNNIPSSINPSEQFLDIDEFFHSLEDKQEELRKKNRKMGVRGIAFFQDKGMNKGGSLVSTLKIIDTSKKNKDLMHLSDVLAYEMLCDPRIMNLVSLALSKVMCQVSLSSMMDKFGDLAKEEDNDKEDEQ